MPDDKPWTAPIPLETLQRRAEAEQPLYRSRDKVKREHPGEQRGTPRISKSRVMAGISWGETIENN